MDGCKSKMHSSFYGHKSACNAISVKHHYCITNVYHLAGWLIGIYWHFQHRFGYITPLQDQYNIIIKYTQ